MALVRQGRLFRGAPYGAMFAKYEHHMSEFQRTRGHCLEFDTSGKLDAARMTTRVLRSCMTPAPSNSMRYFRDLGICPVGAHQGTQLLHSHGVDVS